MKFKDIPELRAKQGDINKQLGIDKYPKKLQALVRSASRVALLQAMMNLNIGPDREILEESLEDFGVLLSDCAKDEASEAKVSVEEVQKKIECGIKFQIEQLRQAIVSLPSTPSSKVVN